MIDWRLNLRAAVGRAYPRVVGGFREPSWLIFDILLPLLGIAAFVYYYRVMHAPEVFAGFVIIGGTMTAYWLNVLWSMAAQFYWEKEVGNLQLCLMAPMSRMSVLAGMALGGMFFTTVRAVSTLLLGIVIFQVKMTIYSPVVLILVFLFTLIALYGMGMMFSSLYLLYGRGAWHTSNLLQEPIYFLSGFYFLSGPSASWWPRQHLLCQSHWALMRCASCFSGPTRRWGSFLWTLSLLSSLVSPSHS